MQSGSQLFSSIFSATFPRILRLKSKDSKKIGLVNTGEYGDKELIGLCLRGQEKGYVGLYERYAVRVYNTISRLVNHQREEAEDLLQEVFVEVFSKIERMQEVESFEAWTKRVAINKSITHLRKQQRMRFMDLDQVHLGEMADGPTEDAIWKENRLEEIEKAIEGLPETSRTIVNLFLFEGMSQEDIGKLLDMSHTAVRSQYHRAKNRIASQVKDREARKIG